MVRVKNSVATRARRKKVLKKAEGYFGSKHRLYKTAHEQVMHSERYAYRDRKQTKEIAVVEQKAKLEGRSMTMLLAPIKEKK